MKAFVKAISYYLPGKVYTNDDLIHEFPEWTNDKIVSKIGVNKRHIAAADETAGDMAVKAARQLFLEYSIVPADIDFVLFCSQSPDYFLPTTACIIQNELGIPVKSGALDFNLGCSGFVYGLAIAKGLIAGGISKNVLLLTSETYSKHIHPSDKGNRSIFGDAAAATLISAEGFAEIGEFCLGTDGRGAGNLIVRTGAFRKKDNSNDLNTVNGNPVSSDFLFMNGSEILSFTLESVPPLVSETLALNNLTAEKISKYVFHQANKFMLDFLRTKLSIDKERFVYSMENTGNTVSATIPIALKEIIQRKEHGGNLLIAGFGVGYSWAATVLKCGDNE